MTLRSDAAELIGGADITEELAESDELEKKLDSLLNDFEYQLRESVKAIDDKALAQKIAREHLSIGNEEAL